MNNFCIPEHYTLKFLTQKETMVMQFSAASPSTNFHSGSYVKKNKCLLFSDLHQLPCKIEKFELEVVGVGILGTGFCFQGSH